MNLRQLETFVLVADTGSFSKAASELYLTQPTVSAHIHALESELNARLFVRNTREVALSADGEKLYRNARRMLSLEREIRADFGLQERPDDEPVILAASTIPAQYLLPDILFRFYDRYPDSQLKLLEMDSSQVIKYISGQMADVGFAGTKLDQKFCRYVPLCRDELVVITPNSEKYRRFLETGGDISWILGEKTIMREEGSGTRREVARMLGQIGIDFDKLDIAVSMDNQETIKKSVRLGMGISILSRLAVEDDLNAGKMLAFPIHQSGQGREIYLVCNRNTRMSKSVRRFLEIVAEIYPGSTL